MTAAAMIAFPAAVLITHPVGPPARVLAGGQYGLATPSAITVDDGHVWIASYTDDRSAASVVLGRGMVTELDAASGHRIRTLRGRRYDFRQPAAITSGGGRIWVASAPLESDGMTNQDTGSVTELSARTGRWIRTLSGGRYGFDAPSAIVASGGHVWVANETTGYTGSVTEISASDGAWIQTIRVRVGPPEALTAYRGHLWIVTSQETGSVIEISTRTGRRVRTLSGGRRGFEFAWGIAGDAGRIWITEGYAGNALAAVVELSARTGRRIATLSGPGYDFGKPAGITADGPSLWVADGWGKLVKLSAAGGRPVQVASSESGWDVIRTAYSPDYQLDAPVAVAVCGPHVWVIGQEATILTVS